MRRLLLFFLVFLLILLVGGGVFLATWDIPAPSARVEKTIPNDQLGK